MQATPESIARMQELERKVAELHSKSKQSIPASLESIAHMQELENRLKSTKATENIKPSLGRSLARGAKDVVTGALDVADLVATPVRAALNLGASAIGNNYRFNPVGENVNEAIDTATHGYTAANTPQEKTISAITRSLASLPSGVGIGGVLAKGAGKIGKLGKYLKESSFPTVPTVATTTATSGAMQDYINEHPNELWGALGTGALAGLGTGAVVGGGRHLLTKTGREYANQELAKKTGNFLKIDPHAIEDFQNSGINPTLPDVSKSKIIKTGSHILGYTPGSSSVMAEAKELQRNKILEGLRQGDYSDVIPGQTEAANLTHKGARISHKNESSYHSELFNKIKEDVNQLPDKTIYPKKLIDVAAKLTAHLSEKSLKKSPAVQQLEEIFSTFRSGGLNYYEAKQIEKNIRDKITTFGLVGKSSQGDLKQIAKALNDDIFTSLKPGMETLGNGAVENWKEAHKVYHAYATHEIPKLNELFKANKKEATDAFINMFSDIKKGAQKAKIALGSLNKTEQKQLSDSVMLELGKANDGSFNPNKWANGFNKLQKNAKEILLHHLTPEERKKVFKIADAIPHLKKTLNEANTSGSTVHASLINKGATAATAAFSAMSGDITPLATMLSGMGAANLTAKAMTNPKIVNWLYNGMRLKNPYLLQKHLNKLESLPVTTRQTIQSGVHAQKYLGNSDNKRPWEQ